VPFLVGCHSRASFGRVAASEFVEEARLLVQYGQPVPPAAL
jgi:hypothetical protein